MKRVAVLTVMLALVAAASVEAAEQQRRQRGEGGPQAFSQVDMLTRALARLDLTAEQKPKIDKLIADRKEKLTELQAKAQLTETQREAMRAAMTKAREDNVAREQMREVIEKAVQRTPEQAKAQEELTKEVTALRAAIGELLTPEQRAQLQRAREGAGTRGEGRPAGEGRTRGPRT